MLHQASARMELPVSCRSVARHSLRVALWVAFGAISDLDTGRPGWQDRGPPVELVEPQALLWNTFCISPLLPSLPCLRASSRKSAPNLPLGDDHTDLRRIEHPARGKKAGTTYALLLAPGARDFPWYGLASRA